MDRSDTDQDKLKSNSVFLTHNSEVATTELNETNQITYTTVMESIPKDRRETTVPNWQDKYKTEWRWRFMTLPDRRTVEISYTTVGEPRKYFNKNGQWVEREVPQVYDKYVDKVLYYYSS